MGDVRQSRKKWDAAENQPLTAREKELVERGYTLFDFFYEQLREYATTRARGARRRRRATRWGAAWTT